MSKKLRKKLNDMIDKEVRGILDHLETHGWSLDLLHIKSDIIHEITSIDIIAEFMKRLHGKAIIGFQNNTFLVHKKDGYYPIYMNRKTGKLVIVENAIKDKSYVMKYREANGWDYIGFL
jgi:uncharacterized phage-like protein YoqJ